MDKQTWLMIILGAVLVGTVAVAAVLALFVNTRKDINVTEAQGEVRPPTP